MISTLLKEIAIRHLVLKSRITTDMTLEQKRLVLEEIKKEEQEREVTPFSEDYLDIMIPHTALVA